MQVEGLDSRGGGTTLWASWRGGGEDKGGCLCVCMWQSAMRVLPSKEGWIAGRQHGGRSLFNRSDENSEEKE